MGLSPRSRSNLKDSREHMQSALRIACRVAFFTVLMVLPALSAAQNTPPAAHAPTLPPTQASTDPSVRPDPISKPIPDAIRPLGLPVRASSQPTSTKPEASSQGATLVRTATSLTAVVALILLAALVVRSLARRQGGIMAAVGPGGRAPSGVVEVLARYPVARSQTLILLKLPRRVIVLAQTRGVRGASSLAALSEIIDAEEIADLVLRTREADNQTIARKFGSILNTEQRGLAKILGVFAPNVNTNLNTNTSDNSTAATARDLAFPNLLAQSRPTPRRVTTSPSGDRVELASTPDQPIKKAHPKPDPARRGYSDAPNTPKPHANQAFTDADLQERLAVLRQIALERNRRAI